MQMNVGRTYHGVQREEKKPICAFTGMCTIVRARAQCSIASKAQSWQGEKSQICTRARHGVHMLVHDECTRRRSRFLLGNRTELETESLAAAAGSQSLTDRHQRRVTKMMLIHPEW